MNNKYINHFLALLAALLMVLSVLLINTDMQAKNEKFYRDFQVENKIDEKTGKSQEQLDEITKDLITYLDTGMTEYLMAFSQREILHMEDVFDLFVLMRSVINISLTILTFIFLSVVLKRQFNQFTGLMANYSIGILAFLGVFSLLVAMYFDWFFVKFHQMFFDNDLWLMDVDKDLMVQMHEQSFFTSIVASIAIRSLTVILAIIALIKIRNYYFEKNPPSTCGLS